MSEKYVIGIDFGTLSGRALVVRGSDGEEIGSAVHEYRHGVIEEALPASGRRLGTDWALQDPEDYLEVLRRAVPAAVKEAGIDAGRRRRGRHRLHRLHRAPDAGRRHAAVPPGEFTDRPHAYVKLWKHHAAQPQADRITGLAHERGEPWIARYGGMISSEWAVRQGTADAGGGPGDLRAGRALDRGRRLDHLAALRLRDPQRVHSGLQGAAAGRAVPVPRVPGGAATRNSLGSPRPSSPIRSHSSASGRAG